MTVNPATPAPVVIDTNVLLDIFVFQDPRTEELRHGLLSQRLDAVRSNQTTTELKEVVARRKFDLSSERQQEILDQWQACSRSMDETLIQTAPWKCKDQDDQIFLDLAYTLRPCILLSKDKQVLRFYKRALREGVQIAPDLSMPTFSIDGQSFR